MLQISEKIFYKTFTLQDDIAPAYIIVDTEYPAS